MTFGQEPHSAVAAKAQLAARGDQTGHFYLHTGHGPSKPVPAFRRICPVPRQRLHVLTSGKSLAPLNEECGGRATFAGIESATALRSFGAFDKEAARLVFKPWPFASLADCGLIELFPNLFISGHGIRFFVRK